MQKFKCGLLAATVIAGLAAVPVSAQNVLSIQAPGLPVSTVTTTGGATFTYDGDNALHGAGGTSIQNVLVRVLNCIGTPAKLGNGLPGQSGSAGTTGSLVAKTPGVFAGTPPLTCNNVSSNVSFTGGTSTYGIQPAGTAATAANGFAAGASYGFAAKYVGAGSGFGRKIWYGFGDVFDGGANANAVAHVYNPFNLIGGDNRWSHVQFAASDTPIAQSDLAAYNTTGNAVSYAGPAIQFPLFVIPVAIAYDTQYGKNAASHAMTFNAQFSQTISGTAIASLRLTAQVYCSIFNGDITNWNDPQLKALNKKVPLYDPVNDTIARWNSDGVPIRLAGRLDTSGNTDVFTRHLAQVCSQGAIYTPVNNPANVNKYHNHAESLPYDSTQNGGVDYTTVRSDVSLKPANNGNLAKLAGTINTISGDWFNGTAIVNLNPGTTISAAPVSYKGSGLYTVANGATNLAKLITLAPDYQGGDGTALNGKIGYLSADYVQPSVDAPGGLVSASIAISGAPFLAPTVANALKAFGTIAPPETATGDVTGAYKAGTDPRIVNLPGSGTGPAARTNPIAWTDVLYQAGATLAQPSTGYPITGTTNFFGYTCYATAGNRQAIGELLGLVLGQINKDSTNTTISKSTFNASSPANPGIVDQSNFGVVPAAWQKAITNTFLTSAGDAGGLGLWIQTALLPKVTKVKGVVTITQPAANTAVCGSLPGA